MNRLLKTMLGVVMCLSSALPAMAEIKVKEDKDDGGVLLTVLDENKLFYSTETLPPTADKQSLKNVLGFPGALIDDGLSELIFALGVGYYTLSDITMCSITFILTDSFKSELDNNDKLTIRFADGNTDDFYILSRIDEEDGLYNVTGVFGALNPKDYEVHRIPMNEEMVQYATSDIESITCGGVTYHIRGLTAPYFKALFATMLNHKEVSMDGFSIYLNSVDAKASSSKAVKEPKRMQEPESSTTAPAVSNQNYGDEETALASLLKNPAGYAGRSPFTSPGIYQPDFERYALQNSLNYRTIGGGGSVSLIFDNGVVPDNLMGYDCKFVASFKNQILNGYVYQSVVLNREQAETLAQKLAAELMGMGNVDRASGFQKSSDALFSEQYLYGAGTRVTVDARQIGGRYAVSLMVSITHF